MKKVEPDLNTDQIVGHYKKHIDKTYIGSHDLMKDDGSYHTAVVTISGTHKREIYNPANKKTDKRTIATFQGRDKQFIMNVTNLEAIADIAGTPMIEKWVGVQIMLTVESVKVSGGMVDALRVKPVQRSAS